jgi:hypothetical protein
VTIGLRQLNATTFDAIDGADISPVLPDDFHVFPDIRHGLLLVSIFCKDSQQQRSCRSDVPTNKRQSFRHDPRRSAQFYIPKHTRRVSAAALSSMMLKVVIRRSAFVQTELARRAATYPKGDFKEGVSNGEETEA